MRLQVSFYFSYYLIEQNDQSTEVMRRVPFNVDDVMHRITPLYGNEAL